jgi:hypothetical protein
MFCCVTRHCLLPGTELNQTTEVVLFPHYKRRKYSNELATRLISRAVMHHGKLISRKDGNEFIIIAQNPRETLKVSKIKYRYFYSQRNQMTLLLSGLM